MQRQRLAVVHQQACSRARITFCRTCKPSRLVCGVCGRPFGRARRGRFRGKCCLQCKFANHEQNCWVANIHTAFFRSTETNHHASPQDKAALSYANREFSDAEHTLGELIDCQAENPRWYEMRAQVSDRLSVWTCTSCMSSGAAQRWSVYRHCRLCGA